MDTHLSDAVNKFLMLKVASLRSEQTIRWYESILGACIQSLGKDRFVTAIQEDDMLLYIKELRDRTTRYQDGKQKPPQYGGLARDSIRSHIRALKAFWRWASLRYDMKDPLQAVLLPQRQQPKIKAISPEHFVQLFEATDTSKCPERDRALLAMLADTGARRGGILSLTVKDVTNYVRRAKLIEKGYKERWIYWTHYTDKLLDKWLTARESETDALWVNLTDGRPLESSAINQILKRLKNRAGISGRVNPHAFRHNFARTYLQSGGDLVTLARLMGHTDVNVTAAYYAVFSSDELAQMQEKHSPLLNMLHKHKPDTTSDEI